MGVTNNDLLASEHLLKVCLTAMSADINS